MRFSLPGGGREVVSEGVAEVKDRLREDISRLKKVRRGITLRTTMECLECEGNGRVICQSCGGLGKAKVVFGDEPGACETCVGSGRIGCVTCLGKGSLANPHRKKVLIVLGVGGVAWLLVFLRLWMGSFDVLPAVRATGGGEVAPRNSPMTSPMSGPGETVQPGGAPGTAPQPGALQPQSGFTAPSGAGGGGGTIAQPGGQ